LPEDPWRGSTERGQLVWGFCWNAGLFFTDCHGDNGDLQHWQL